MMPVGRTSQDGLALKAAARDLLTGRDGSAIVIDEASLVAELGRQRELVSLRVQPETPAAQALLGVTVRQGFRAALQSSIPDVVETRSPLHLLLDDLPVAALIAGYADMHVQEPRVRRDRGGAEGPRADICAGWASDATMMRAAASGDAIAVSVGPVAPVLEGGDPLGWHALDVLRLGAMRRRRLIEVLPGEALEVRAMFRDSHVGADSVERVLHEYDLHATIDPATGVVVSCDATPMVLPWPECPTAAGSAHRLVGQPIASVRNLVRSEFRGTTTCTHLNDLLRSLADVVPLARAVGVDVGTPAG
jgi:hypothetical protein